MSTEKNVPEAQGTAGAQPLTQAQAAIVGAYTGVLCGDFGTMHEYVERVMGRPVWTHEMGDSAVVEQIKAAARADFLALCAPRLVR